MRKFLFKVSMFLTRHMWLYYLLNLTWGALTTYFGLLLTLLILPFKRPERFAKTYCFKLKKNWGGLTVGMMFFRDTTSIDHVSMHEYGHTFQNAILGPFMIFIVGIPSTIRYWYRHLKYERKGLMPFKKYDDIWFEGSATEIGSYAYHNVH